jgi:predicted metal-dependent HD superfamily phosphohydrolase
MAPRKRSAAVSARSGNASQAMVEAPTGSGVSSTAGMPSLTAAITYSLVQLDRVAPTADEADVIELAIWFHDVIYEINRSDNEARSAELLRDLANGKLDAGLIDRAEELILATTHKAATDDVTCQYMLDIDLAGFGRPWAEFVANSVAIREEQQSSPAQEIAFLDMLDARQRIFQSDYFFERLEPRARSNIARYRADCVSRKAGAG